MSKLKKFVLFLFALVVLIPLFSLGITSLFAGEMHNSNIDTTDLDNFTHANKEGIKNILIMGTDARPGDTVSRTDSMMIVTVDSIHDDIKITSLARDTFVDIPGHGKSKLTHAYAFGKEALLIKTVEENFGIDINDFVMIDFKSFMAIIDSVDGVELDVKESEIAELNKFIPETYNWDTNKDKGEMKLIEKAGVQKLNGYQALSYARIRHNDSAFGRDNRQRLIVSSMLKSIKNSSKFKYPFILKSATPYIDTNMKSMDILKYMVSVMAMGVDNIKQMEFPIVTSPKYTTGGVYGSYGWVLRYDPESVKFLKQFIFDDIEYQE